MESIRPTCKAPGCTNPALKNGKKGYRPLCWKCRYAKLTPEQKLTWNARNYSYVRERLIEKYRLTHPRFCKDCNAPVGRYKQLCPDCLTRHEQQRRAYENKTAVVKQLKARPCQVCGWYEAPCDLHRIKPGSEGGLYTEDNVKVLCPNCHRLQHRKESNASAPTDNT